MGQTDYAYDIKTVQSTFISVVVLATCTHLENAVLQVRVIDEVMSHTSTMMYIHIFVRNDGLPISSSRGDGLIIGGGDGRVTGGRAGVLRVLSFIICICVEELLDFGV